jgi:hypothetical protein
MLKIYIIIIAIVFILLLTALGLFGYYTLDNLSFKDNKTLYIIGIICLVVFYLIFEVGIDAIVNVFQNIKNIIKKLKK